MRKKCKRKVYALIDPIKHAIEGAAITSEKALNQLRMRELLAIEAFRQGKATDEDWKTVTDMMNIAETMGRHGIGPEVLEYVEMLQKSMHEALERYKKINKMGTNGLGLKAMNEVYEYHDLQRKSVSRSIYESMIKKTGDYIRSRNELVVTI